MLRSENNYHYCLNDLTILNFDNIGTAQQGKVISAAIKNWDEKRYLRPNDIHLRLNLSRSKRMAKTYDATSIIES